MFKQIKSHLLNDTTFYTLIIIVVAVGGFGLGRLSVSENTHNALEMEQTSSRVEATNAASSSVKGVNENSSVPSAGVASSTEVVATPAGEGRFVASRKGTKYHLISCPGASQIKPENKLFFTTAEAARAAGYTPASNCPGLQ